MLDVGVPLSFDDRGAFFDVLVDRIVVWKNRNRDDFATTNTMTMTTNEGRTGDGERISEEKTKTTTRRELLMSKDSEFGEKNKQKTPTYHTIFSTECNTYFDWQSLGLYYSFKKVKQKEKSRD